MKIKNFFSKMLNKHERSFKVLVLMMMVLVAFSSNIAYAADPKLVTGTVDLFKAITGWLLLIIPVGAGAMVGYHALQKSLTDDDSVIADKNKKIKNTLIGAAIAMTADGLVTIVLAFYK